TRQTATADSAASHKWIGCSSISIAKSARAASHQIPGNAQAEKPFSVDGNRLGSGSGPLVLATENRQNKGKESTSPRNHECSSNLRIFLWASGGYCNSSQRLLSANEPCSRRNLLSIALGNCFRHNSHQLHSAPGAKRLRNSTRTRPHWHFSGITGWRGWP